MAFTEVDYTPVVAKVYVPKYNRYVKAGQSVPIVIQVALFTPDGLYIPWSFLVSTDEPKITIFDPSETIIINLVTMNYTSTGFLNYTFDTTGRVSGVYSAVFKGIHSNALIGQTVKHQILNNKVVVCRIV